MNKLIFGVGFLMIISFIIGTFFTFTLNNMESLNYSQVIELKPIQSNSQVVSLLCQMYDMSDNDLEYLGMRFAYGEENCKFQNVISGEIIEKNLFRDDTGRLNFDKPVFINKEEFCKGAKK